ncbi:esterase/lipase superfamily enzyme [Litoreibacter meonggei]|uniref:Esterase/lipase superfamily enzyme n=1 Tax=Litoreibacter meonggei TaxID=1049199 RepID=A0A497WG61_9RHOB|nr:alpha/beta fold hydrolase [Litoreibacter meonggei]RLJ52088.1 esterase/lipase superfamily enzyme [Litoreibacter meonggei]
MKVKLLLLIAAMLLTACSFRGGLARVPVGLEPATERSIFFATTRQTDRLPFGSLRSRDSVYGLVDVSIPPNHKAGKIEWPNANPDPQKHFLLANTEAYQSGADLRANINRALAAKKPKNRDVIIFVHGFNNRFSDGLYRIAQMSHDLNLPGVAMTYSWPSAGNPLNYAYDRDSALFARDGLRRLINEVTKSNARNVLLVAHSLGSLVTMETLRELRVSGNTRALNRIGGVVLMSPDIDLDVFKSQADTIGKLPDPFIVFSSKKDRALRLIERVTGQKNRLGLLEDVSEIAEYDITYIDVTAYSEGGINHFPTAKSPALLKLLGQVPDLERALSADGGRPGLLPGTVLTVQNATTLILSPVASR